MRPPELNSLFAPVESLPQIGKVIAKLITKLAGPSVKDLLWHLPIGVTDRTLLPNLAVAELGKIATLKLTIEGHEAAFRHRPARIRASDETGFVFLIYFKARPDYLLKLLPPGSERIVSGRLDEFNGARQITHPDFVLPIAEATMLARFEPNYRLTAGLSNRQLASYITSALHTAPDLAEWLNPKLLRQLQAPSWLVSLLAAHQPKSVADTAPIAPARARLAFDELLAHQLALALVRAHHKNVPGRNSLGSDHLAAAIRGALPFRLTAAQTEALAEIESDLAAPSRMLRLLQGDVGSGKTIVALLAMARVIAGGGQTALLAPTDLLARQHFATLENFAGPHGIRLALLTGRDRGSVRATQLEAIQSGSIDLVIGTHALIQSDIVFNDLAFAVIDEQHRFGVDQRVALGQKGRAVDILVMSATPIPRSLALASYGDLDISRLMEKPAGRQKIETVALPLTRLDEVIGAIARAIDQGRQAYWVCPLIEESETSDTAAAIDRHHALVEHFGPRVGLMHGRIKLAVRDEIMREFIAGSVQILVATTVIEVGIDVPGASIMVIEHAERFGLAQLHQLRGRVGRGAVQSSCLLLYQPPLSETAHARLAILRETDDGFRIAEEDLRLRGAGEILGKRQSGLPNFRLADLTVHKDLLSLANSEARAILDSDPDLTSPRGLALRRLLYLFERDTATRYVSSG